MIVSEVQSHSHEWLKSGGEQKGGTPLPELWVRGAHGVYVRQLVRHGLGLYPARSLGWARE